MEEDELLHIHSMLHLIFHRNRNQHGRTKWWKWLSVLKRAVWGLAVSLSPNNPADSRSSTESYKRYLADRVLPRCYVAFSVVVADVQFSALGAVLFATLARLAKSTGIDKELKSAPLIVENREDVPSFHRKASKHKEDIGEALSRPAAAVEEPRKSETQQTVQPTPDGAGDTKPSKPKPSKSLDTDKTKRKKKQKKNAIDDLFAGLM